MLLPIKGATHCRASVSENYRFDCRYNTAADESSPETDLGLLGAKLVFLYLLQVCLEVGVLLAM